MPHLTLEYTDNLAHRPLVVGAHAAECLWRSVGPVATVTEAGGEATALALSYGERAESGALPREHVFLDITGVVEAQ